jgi:hypothetical protein
MRTVARRFVAAFVALRATLVPAAHAQTLAPRDATAPRFVNIVHQTLRPGRATAYREMLRVIARTYDRLDIPAYWVELRSMTGRPAMLSLNLFNSFDEVERAASGMGKVLAGDPELTRLQDELLTHISDEQTVLTVRRDDITAPAPASSLAATMRLLRVTTITAVPGRESNLAGALRTACAESESTQPASRCLVYEADAGVGNPTFVLLVPLASLGDVGTDIASRHGFAPTSVNSAIGPSRSLPDVAQMACASECTTIETQIYIVDPVISHVPADFATADPAYWTPPVAKPQKAPR